MKSLKEKFIFVIFGVSFLFFLIGIWYGLPMHLVGDEESLIGGAMKMIETQNLIPTMAPDDFNFLYYPVLIPYAVIVSIIPLIMFKLVYFGFDFTAVRDFFAMNQTGIWASARIASAFFGSLLVVVLYKFSFFISKNRKIAFLSSVFLVFSFFQLVLSNFVRHWIYSVFFIYLLVYLTFLFVSSKKIRYLYLITFLFSLGINVSYLTGLSFLVIFVLIIYNFKDIKPLLSSRVVLYNFLIFLFVGVGGLLLNVPEIIKILTYDSSLSNTKNWSDYLYLAKSFILVLWRQETAMFVLFCFSFLLKSTRKYAFLLVLLFVYYTSALYLFFHFELRYVFPLIPFMAFISGAVAYELISRFKGSRVLYFLVLFFVFFWPVTTGIKYLYLLSVKDTRQQALVWIEENLDSKPFLVSSDAIFLPRTSEFIEKDLNLGRVRAYDRYYLKNPKNDFYEKRYKYLNMHFWDDGQKFYALDIANKNNIRYFIVDYWDRGQLSDEEIKIIEKGELVKVFTQTDRESTDVSYNINGNFNVFNSVIFSLQRLGPRVEIYKIY